MTRFRDELDLLAAQAPAVDLADRALHRARRQRIMSAIGTAAATVAALAVCAAVLTSAAEDPRKATITTVTSDTLPASGVDPLSHAFYDFCRQQWDPGKNTQSFAGKECVQWQVVTRGGQTYRMPEALSVFTEQNGDNYMNTGAPMVITPSGKRIAYYSEKDARFAVRDLASGQIWLIPQPVTRADLVAHGPVLKMSPDGRLVSAGVVGSPLTIVEVETGKATPVPEGWYIQSIADNGTAVATSSDDRHGLLIDGQAHPFPAKGARFGTSALAEDGRRLAFTTGGTSGVNTKPDDTIVTVDTTTGEVLSETTFKNPPKDFSPIRMGGWLSATEVMVADSIRGNWPNDATGLPTLGDVTYAIDTTTGEIRELATYPYRAWAGDQIVPGL